MRRQLPKMPQERAIPYANLQIKAVDPSVFVETDELSIYSRPGVEEIERQQGRGRFMARELAIPCFLARVAAGVALFVIGGVAADSLAVAAEASTGAEASAD